MRNATHYHTGAALCLLASVAAPAVSAAASSPLPCRIIEYTPAPGQFINTDLSDPTANPLLTEGELLTLGAFGGNIVIALDQPIFNRQGCADFAIVGNAMTDGITGETSASEPAAVQVMVDLNGNGLPDDGEWMELAGSDYRLQTTRRNTTITYRNPWYSVAHDVPWATSDGVTGALLAVAAHSQPYYPDSYLFPAIGEELSLSGNLIHGAFNTYNPQNISYAHLPAFGYADTHQSDSFDIDWAVDSDGNNVELDHIDFIRIYTAGQRNLGRIGEWSSEIDYIAAIEPSEPTECYLNYLYTPEATLLAGEEMQLEGMAFRNGRPIEGTTAEYTSSAPGVASVAADATLKGLAEGIAVISFSATDKAAPDKVEIAVVTPVGMAVTIGEKTAQTATAECIVGEEFHIQAVTLVECKALFPSSGQYAADNYTFVASAPEVGTIDAYGCFHALSAGTTVISVWRTANPNHYAEVQVRVKAAPPVVLLRKELTIPADQPQGAYRGSALLRTTNKSEPQLITAESRLGLLACRAEGNRLVYDCNGGDNASESGTLTDTILLTVEHYGNHYTFDLPVTFTRTLSGIEAPTAATESYYREVYTTTGQRAFVSNNLTESLASVMKSLPEGTYILREGSTVKKILKK